VERYSIKQDPVEVTSAEQDLSPPGSSPIATTAIRCTGNDTIDYSRAQLHDQDTTTLVGIPAARSSLGEESGEPTSSQPMGASPEGFHSILFERPEDRTEILPSDAPLFADLNLDQIIAGIVMRKEEYDLKPFFCAPLRSVRAIAYRQQIMKDLEDPSLLSSLRRFAQAMYNMREYRVQSDQLRNKYQKEAWFIDAVAIYCEAVNSLAADLAVAHIKARGLIAFRQYLSAYVTSDRFLSLLEETKTLKADLSSIRYSVIIRDGNFTVRNYEDEPDYSAEVERVFERFRLGAVKDYTVRFRDKWPEMNNVEEKILEFVANLNPDIFLRLDNCCVMHDSYLDDTIRAFDCEIQFYISYLEYVSRLTREGLKFCYPEVSADRKDVFGSDTFDLALAQKHLTDRIPIVCNDFYLKDKERIFVVTGPNQGGKTTFARTFGQLHYFGNLGCPVPGGAARVLLFDRLFTHFQRVEDPGALRGALEDSLIRIHDILAQATPSSVIILNEIFTSTTVRDALFLSRKVLATVIELDLLCVCVTFVDELALLGDKVVSMVATVVPENPSVRTYKIVRKPAQGLAWAMSIAEKYRVTYTSLRERLKP
jgi:DNA mismatch repair protein MutS